MFALAQTASLSDLQPSPETSKQMRDWLRKIKSISCLHRLYEQKHAVSGCVYSVNSKLLMYTSSASPELLDILFLQYVHDINVMFLIPYPLKKRAPPQNAGQKGVGSFYLLKKWPVVFM